MAEVPLRLPRAQGTSGARAGVAARPTARDDSDRPLPGLAYPSFTLEQDGENLTGHYSSDTLGEIDFTGTVEGSTVTIAFEASMQGQSIPVVYIGTVAEDGTISGTIDLAAGALTGTFTATRVDG